MWKFRRLESSEKNFIISSDTLADQIDITANIHPLFPLNDKTFDFSSEAGKKVVWTSNSKHEKTFC